MFARPHSGALSGALVLMALACPPALAQPTGRPVYVRALVWAAAAPFLAHRPGVELFLAMAVLPIFMLPALSRRLIHGLTHRPAAEARAQRLPVLPGRPRGGEAPPAARIGMPPPPA